MNTLRVSLLGLFLLAAPVAADTIRIEYEVSMDSGIQLQVGTVVSGVLTYDTGIPPIWTASAVASYGTISHVVTIDGVSYGGTPAVLQAYDNSPDGGLFRDMFFAETTLSGPMIGDVVIESAGLRFEQSATAPSVPEALTGLALPASFTDLDGFVGGERRVFITLANTATNSFYYIPNIYHDKFTVTNLAQTPIPEPSTWLLVAFGAVGVGWVRRRRRAA